MPGCKARRVSDQMSCDHCGLLWDVNDPDPPSCKIDNIVITERNATSLITPAGDHDTEIDNINRILGNDNENNGS